MKKVRMDPFWILNALESDSQSSVVSMFFFFLLDISRQIHSCSWLNGKTSPCFNLMDGHTTYSLSLKSWFFLHWNVFNNFIFTRHVHSSLSTNRQVLRRNVLGHVFFLLFPLFLWCRKCCLPLSFKTSGSHVGLT